jgi:3-oxoacyl-[acyl-carrier-protein] synthase-3
MLGIGVAVSGDAVTTEEMDRRLGPPAGTVEARTGVRQCFVERHLGRRRGGGRGARGHRATARLAPGALPPVS